MGTKITVMDRTGHSTLLVEPEGEVAQDEFTKIVTADEAREAVENHIGLGGLAYTTSPLEVVQGYDPTAQETVLAPRMGGG